MVLSRLLTYISAIKLLYLALGLDPNINLFSEICIVIWIVHSGYSFKSEGFW